MSTYNDNGVYEKEITEELARQGRSCVQLHFCECQDGLYRFALSMMWSYGGFFEPITDDGTGYATAALAKEHAFAKLLRRWPSSWATEPQSAHAELAALRDQVEQKIRQPSLF